jgi:hypothetical protein
MNHNFDHPKYCSFICPNLLFQVRKQPLNIEWAELANLYTPPKTATFGCTPLHVIHNKNGTAADKTPS